MKVIIIIGIILVAIAIISDKVLRKKFNVNKEDNMSKENKRAQSIILTVLFVVYLIFSFILIAKYEELNTMYIIIPFLLVISFIRAFMQWRYHRNANIWKIEIFGALYMASAFILISLLATALLN